MEKILESAWLHYNSLYEHSIGVSYAYEIGIGIGNLFSLVSGCRKVKPNNNQYILQHPRIDFFKKIPLYACPNEWNNAGDIIHYNNKTTFKIALKDKLLCEVEEEHIKNNL